MKVLTLVLVSLCYYNVTSRTLTELVPDISNSSRNQSHDTNKTEAKHSSTTLLTSLVDVKTKEYEPADNDEDTSKTVVKDEELVKYDDPEFPHLRPLPVDADAFDIILDDIVRNTEPEIISDIEMTTVDYDYWAITEPYRPDTTFAESLMTTLDPATFDYYDDVKELDAATNNSADTIILTTSDNRTAEILEIAVENEDKISNDKRAESSSGKDEEMHETDVVDTTRKEYQTADTIVMPDAFDELIVHGIKSGSNALPQASTSQNQTESNPSKSSINEEKCKTSHSKADNISAMKKIKLKLEIEYLELRNKRAKLEIENYELSNQKLTFEVQHLNALR